MVPLCWPPGAWWWATCCRSVGCSRSSFVTPISSEPDVRAPFRSPAAAPALPAETRPACAHGRWHRGRLPRDRHARLSSARQAGLDRCVSELCDAAWWYGADRRPLLDSRQTLRGALRSLCRPGIDRGDHTHPGAGAPPGAAFGALGRVGPAWKRRHVIVSRAGFPDLFSRDASAYAQFRPRYTAALFEWIAALPARRRRALACATGKGRAADMLAGHFALVLALDASRPQLRAATRATGVYYLAAVAESSPVGSGAVGLLSGAQ